MSFDIKFRSERIAKAARNTFELVHEQSNKQEYKGETRQLGAVFCQLQEIDLILLKDERTDKLRLVGDYLPPKWATRINRVLRAYHEEIAKELEEVTDELVSTLREGPARRTK